MRTERFRARGTSRSFCLGVALLAGLCPVRAGRAAGEISLRDAGIRVAPDQPACVLRAVDDLRAVIASRTGRRPDSMTAPGPAGPGANPLIAVGLTPWAQAAEALPPKQRENPEAYVLCAEPADGNGRVTISVAGRNAPGLQFGLIELIRRVRLKEADATLAVPFHAAAAPRMATRGLYAHLHWSYHRPYALRSWELPDWKRYVDLLAHLGFNTIQVWPMMELLPHPLSAEDRTYLERYAAIVDDAHRERGMKVILGSCPNNITEDARGVPVARREYFDFEKRLDPGDPVGLKRILEHRGDLYRTVPDADAYWVIDSDPGGWKGSPSSDFVEILMGHRRLIDEFGRRPREQPLIYWMWFGWGTGDRADNWKATLSEMKQRLPEPWRLHACHPHHLEVCRALGLLPRTTYFPYNTLENEPSGPLTELRYARIAEQVDIARRAGLGSIQGNTQTPLVQLPNIAFLAWCAWGEEASEGEQAALDRLADRILARDSEVLSRAWRSLGGRDADDSLRLAGRLRALAADPGARGTLAVVLGDWQTRVLEDLATMLEIHAHALRFAAQVDAGAAPATLAAALGDFIASGARWLDRTGYHDRDPIAHDAYRQPVAEALARLAQQMGPDAMIGRIVTPAAAAQKDCAPDQVRLVVDSVVPK